MPIKTSLLQYIGLLIKSKLWETIFFDFDTFKPSGMLDLILHDQKTCLTVVFC